jgi:glycosyltransferase involved in cell wall biosynthesis
MHLSIVIPAWNEEKLLPATLSALIHAVQPLADAGLTHEIIVCDNNSTDRTASIAAEHGVRVVREPVNQISRARNTGASIAAGDWLLFLDADSTPSAALMNELAAALHDDSILYGGCAIVMDEARPGTRLFVGLWHWIAKHREWAAGSFFFCRRAAFEQTGGFSTELYASEEIEFSKRLRKLARARKQRFVFFTAHPLVTSARKLKWRGAWWHAGFVFRTALCLGRNLKRRDGCELWYDGKR